MKSKLTYYTTITFIAALLFISCSKDSPSTEPQNMCSVAANTFNVDGNKLAQLLPHHMFLTAWKIPLPFMHTPLMAATTNTCS